MATQKTEVSPPAWLPCIMCSSVCLDNITQVEKYEKRGRPKNGAYVLVLACVLNMLIGNGMRNDAHVYS